MSAYHEWLFTTATFLAVEIVLLLLMAAAIRRVWRRRQERRRGES